CKYESLNSHFKKAFDYIRSLDFNNLKEGTVKLSGEDLFVNVVKTQLKDKQDASLESHNEYIDIQVPVSKEETFGWTAREKCKSVAEPYSSGKDIEFYSDSPSVYFSLTPGEFAVFFPQDAHAPCIGLGETKKIIVKVRV
ncbi:MAG: YhcH/YjgK/YiaL family protein, partial [Bacteroidales bacterium]|nr:YhcH/YjgK/YiaL family protein [Bacteroidales bacterium]